MLGSLWRNRGWGLVQFSEGLHFVSRSDFAISCARLFHLMARRPAASTSPVIVIISRHGMRVQFRYVWTKPVAFRAGMFRRFALISTSTRYCWPGFMPQSYHAVRCYRNRRSHVARKGTSRQGSANHGSALNKTSDISGYRAIGPARPLIFADAIWGPSAGHSPTWWGSRIATISALTA
jgi:hypothetical protein